jgi:hypothetical protein
VQNELDTPTIERTVPGKPHHTRIEVRAGCYPSEKEELFAKQAIVPAYARICLVGKQEPKLAWRRFDGAPHSPRPGADGGARPRRRYGNSILAALPVAAGESVVKEPLAELGRALRLTVIEED